MNIRTPLIRSGVAIGLILLSALAISATPRPQPAPAEAPEPATDVAEDAPLAPVWLPAVAVYARAEALPVARLPTIRVRARTNRIAAEGGSHAPPVPIASSPRIVAAE